MKPKIHSVKYNVLMNMILTSSGFIFPLITVPYVSRVLQPSGTGIVSWAQTFVGYFALFAVMGINSYGVRECARVRDDLLKLSQVVKELLVLLLLSSSIVSAIYLITIFCVPQTRSQIPLMLIFGVVIWLSACGVEWFYQSIEQYGYITIRNIVFKLIGLVLMFVLVRNVNDYRLYAVTIVVGAYGSNVLNILRLRKFVNFNTGMKLNLRRHCKPLISFAVSSISSGIYSQMELFLLGFLGTDVMLGLYQLVLKIKNLCVSAVNSVGNVMLPRLSYYESLGKQDRTITLLGKNINFLCISSFALMSMLIICGKPIIMILGGPSYINANIALALISPVMLFSSLNSILSQYLVATGREKQYAMVNMLGVAFGFIFGIIFIPMLGIQGAAISVCLCELGALAIRLWLLRSALPMIREHTNVIKILMCSLLAFVVAAGCSWVVRSTNTLLELVVPAFIFLFIYCVMLLISKEKFVRSLIHR